MNNHSASLPFTRSIFSSIRQKQDLGRHCHLQLQRRRDSCIQPQDSKSIHTLAPTTTTAPAITAAPTTSRQTLRNIHSHHMFCRVSSAHIQILRPQQQIRCPYSTHVQLLPGLGPIGQDSNGKGNTSADRSDSGSTNNSSGNSTTKQNVKALVTAKMTFEARVVELAFRELVSLLKNGTDVTTTGPVRRVTRGSIKNTYWNLCSLLNLDPLVIEEHARCETISETALVTFLLFSVLRHEYGARIHCVTSNEVASLRHWIYEQMFRVFALQDPPQEGSGKGHRRYARNARSQRSRRNSAENRIMFLLYMMDCLRHDLPRFCPRPFRPLFNYGRNDALVQSVFVLLDIVVFMPLSTIPLQNARRQVEELRSAMNSASLSQLCIMAIESILQHSMDSKEGFEVIGEIMDKMSQPDAPYVRLDEESISDLIRRSHVLPPSVRWKWLLFAYRSHGVNISFEMLECILEDCYVVRDYATVDKIMQFVSRNPLLISHRVSVLLFDIMVRREHESLDAAYFAQSNEHVGRRSEDPSDAQQ